MRKSILGPTLAIMLASTAAAQDAELSAHADAMYAAVKGDPAKAVVEANFLIDAFARQFGDPGTDYFCVADGQEDAFSAAIHSGDVATAHDKVMLIEDVWCDPWFVSGFAQIDLNRSDLAEPLLRRAIELAPWNAQYRNEYAELFKSRRDWTRAYDLFAAALSAADHSSAALEARDKARALRGMGYAKIELGALAEAESLFHRSQIYEPASKAAANELEYIARLKSVRH
jgi:tetratricopeptide (TPR) repeat protein